jgi:hypothetical protein
LSRSSSCLTLSLKKTAEASDPPVAAAVFVYFGVRPAAEDNVLSPVNGFHTAPADLFQAAVVGDARIPHSDILANCEESHIAIEPARGKPSIKFQAATLPEEAQLSKWPTIENAKLSTF